MAKFNWRLIEAADVESILNKWWSDWNWPKAPSLDQLPANGVLVYDDETKKPLYAGFLYITGTTLGWMEYIVSNKQATPDEKRGGFNYLVETISTIAKTKGITDLFSTTIDGSFVQSLRKTGFQIGDKNATNMIKNLY